MFFLNHGTTDIKVKMKFILETI